MITSKRLESMNVQVIEYKKPDILKFLIDLLINSFFLSFVLWIWLPYYKAFLSAMGIYYVYQLIMDDIRGR